MDVPFYTVCKADPAVLTLLGSPEPRIFPFGEAPQDVARPYVVYQWINGDPKNILSGRPKMDQPSLQIDVYGLSSQSSSETAKAIRYAVELDCYLTSYRGTTREEETKLYRTSFDIDWMVNRS